MDLDVFDAAKQIKLPARVCLIAKTCCGKSIYARSLLYQLRDQIHTVIVFSATAFNGFWSAITPHVFEEWDEALVKRIMEANKKAGKEIVLVLDDCIENESIDLHRERGSLLNKLFSMGRHYHISLLVTTQKLRSLSTLIRTNLDYAILFPMCNDKEFGAVYEEFSAVSRPEFERMFHEYVHSYQVIVYDNTGYTVKYYVDKAEPVPDDFRVPGKLHELFPELKRKKTEAQPTVVKYPVTSMFKDRLLCERKPYKLNARVRGGPAK